MKKPVLFTLGAFLSITAPIFADVTAGQKYQLNLVDVDGNAASTADGHITTVVLSTQSGIDKARVVGDRTPDFCLGNPTYRMITVVVFEKPHSKPTRMLLASIVRHRLDSEGHRLQNRYDKLKISRDARRDVSAVADFDGAITKEFGLKPEPGLFRVLVFAKDGRLTKQWSDVPAAEDLTAALKEN
jgi:hypothetical protein